MPPEKKKSKQSSGFKQKAAELLKARLKRLDTPLSDDEIQKLVNELDSARMESELAHQDPECTEVENEHRVLEEIFRQFLENSPVYVFFKDENIRSIYLSRNYEEMLGLPLDKLLGKTMDELFPSELARQMIANDKQILKEGKKITVEETFNGRNYLTIKFPVQIKGKPNLLAGFTLDISDSKKAELALINSEKKYRKLHESIRDGFVYVSMQGSIIESNKVYQDMLGYTPEELSKLSYVDITPEKWHEMENRIVREQILPNGDSRVYEKEYRKKDGTIFPVELRTFLINDDNNQPLGMWAIVRDISDRKKAEKLLSESEHRANAMLSAIPDLLFRVSRQGFFIDYKAHKEDLFVQSLPTLVGANYHDTMPPEFAEMMDEKIANALETGKIQTFEYNLDIPGKGVRYYEARMLQSGFDEVIAITRDFTERKLMENALNESKAQLIELNATKDKFLSIIAHDLKNPFTAIVGFSNLLITQIKNHHDGNVLNYADNILQSSERVMELLNNLQEWSRAQTGRISFKPALINLSELSTGIIHLLNASANQKSISIKNNIPADEMAYADKAMINTVLRNLISNAIKFTDFGGKISVSAEKNEEEVLLTITDNGVGIPKESLDMLFKMDQNYSTPGTNNEKGTGFGLILCKEFVQKHGGKIWVESTEGAGSKFFFTLPDKN